MPQVSYRVREYLWVTAPVLLEAFCAKLSSKLGLNPFNFDAENVYEWGITKIENGAVEINVSRKHNRGEPLLNEPIHILLLVENIARRDYDSEWIIQNIIPIYGQTIANLTHQHTYYGKVEYLRSDDFSYHPSRIFEPHY